ncbi:MAG: sensor histidine kinase [Clostridia bacterium]|nr:sensor histidine kinase [Clostridia bacterium]
MKELSLNILDISKNSVKAGAELTEIYITEDASTLTLEIKDNGCGMKKEMLDSVTDPFTTTRTTRPVGMGIPLLKLAAEMTEGSFRITSRSESEYPENHGTEVTAVFNKNHIDFTPLGDVISSITTLIQGSPNADFLFNHTTEKGEVTLDTRELRAVLGDVSLDTFEVILWIQDYLKEQYEALK